MSSQPWPGLAVVNVSMVNWVKGTADGEPRRLVVDGTVFEPKVIPSSLRGQLDDPEYVIDMSRCDTEQDAKQGGAAYDYIRKHVYTFVRDKANTADEEHYKEWLRGWWRPWRPRLDFLTETDGLARIVVCSRHAARPIFVFMSRDFFPTESLQLFGVEDDYSFGVLQSSFHWTWALGVGSKIKEDTRYTSEVWETFPWPQEPTETQVAAVAVAARALRQVREKLMHENAWSLRDLHQSAEGASTHPLNDAQAALDAAVADAYGIPPDQGPIEFLLELNQLVAQDEQQGRKVRGPGLPDHLDPKDPHWFSTDCIEPPPVES